MSFAARLASRVQARESQLVLGLDPDPRRLWPEALAAAPAGGRPAERTAAAVVAHCAALMEAAGPACVAAKLQLACFERLGAPGWRALEEVIELARAAGLLAIADGKRADVPVTATAYAQALVGSTPGPLGDVRGLGVDAFTASPLLGRDALVPLVEAARAAGAGTFVVVRTSNPGAADLQDLAVAGASHEGAAPLWELVARMVDRLGETDPGPGLADVGAVAGATAPDHLERMRELMPRAVFLLPGVGAQGGRVEDLGPAFAPGPAGGLVAVSRAIADAHAQAGGDPRAAAAEAARRLRAAAWRRSGAGG
ncbi:MAG TPA: orotidine-5'-phosphate decarboxylase [Solirubrobacteraceae bacterium]|jgi:orotidine-5'-phosphate decarboxylase|nr:orotidine-5'-phosphate decarboxylase [Solirubrobacteraceae bacterium]